jgi:CheY-like chemotaxis protein
LVEALARPRGRLTDGQPTPRANEVKPAPQQATDTGARYTILLAEDNAINQRLAVSLLEREGHRVDVAPNGQRAIEALERRRYDLVLMDVQMPEVDGLEATRRIRERTDALARIPIIAMTANAMKGDEETCRQAGMDGYLAKPIEREKLYALVRTWGAKAHASAAEQSAAPDATAEPMIVAESGPAKGQDTSMEQSAALDAMAEPTIIADDVLAEIEATLGRGGLLSMVADLIKECRERVADINRVLPLGDIDALSAHAHALKSTSGNFGLAALSARAAAVERACREGQRAAALSLATTLEVIARSSIDQLAQRYPDLSQRVA